VAEFTGFDADAFLEALKPPSIRLGGDVLVGKILSKPEQLAFTREMSQFLGNELSDEQARDFLTRVLTAMGFPADRLIALPGPALEKALISFFAAQYQRPTTAEPTPSAPMPSASGATPS